MEAALRPTMRFVAVKTEDQQARVIPQFASGEALATMCLTEPDAGSDLSRIRCRAVQAGDGWSISGEKIFISGGDQDMSEKIHHLVLARTSDDGVKGLSLFLCPCTRADGSRNAVTVTRIEEKMGLHASPTCQLAFDSAVAELVGDARAVRLKTLTCGRALDALKPAKRCGACLGALCGVTAHTRAARGV